MLKVTSWKVYAITCACGSELPSPYSGSLNWQADEPNAETVTCYHCGKVSKTPKALLAKKAGA